MDKEYYSRQMPLIGERGQSRLSGAKIAVVGSGGLGSQVASQLVRTGVGEIILIDDDRVEVSNLHRVSIFDRKDIGKPKVSAAKEKLKSINPDSNVRAMKKRIGKSDTGILEGCDLVIDCTDNMESRFVINEFCVRNRIPWIYGAVSGHEGISCSFAPGGRPCLRCLYPNVKSGKMLRPKKESAISPVVATAASWQVMEAIEILTGRDEFGVLLTFNLKESVFDHSRVKPRKDCEVCGNDG